MAVESATYIIQLNSSYPAGSETKGEGDDHLRLLKAVLQAQFTSLGAAAVTVTAAQLNDVVNKAPIASPTLTGTPAAPTAAAGTNSTQIATTAYVQTAIAAVNAVAAVTASYTSSTSFSVSEGQVVAATASGAVAATFPATPSAVGVVCGVIFDNGRTDNTVDLGANGIYHNGVAISGVITNGARVPMFLRWYGDYWRFI